MYFPTGLATALPSPSRHRTRLRTTADRPSNTSEKPISKRQRHDEQVNLGPEIRESFDAHLAVKMQGFQRDFRGEIPGRKRRGY